MATSAFAFPFVFALVLAFGFGFGFGFGFVCSVPRGFPYENGSRECR